MFVRLSLRTLVRASSVAAFVLATLTPHASAQSYPAKPVRVIVASTAGSNPDTIARIAAPGLSAALGQQVIIDNRAGAGGNIGAEAAARAPADGYTVFLAHTNHSINTALYRKLNYDLVNDFTPVTMLALSAFVATVHPSLPARSVRDLLNIAKARPGDLNFASAGTGSGTYFAAEYFNGLGNVRMLHIAYSGGGPALTSIVSGETSVYFAPLATGLPHIRSGRLRALGVTSAKRLPELPQVPAIAETLPGYEVLSWAGLMLPVKASKEVGEVIHKAALAAVARPDVSKRFEELGFMVVTQRPEEMAAYLKAEIAKYGKLIRQVGMPLQ